jgi:LacI family gluconate utilization system Gnt-I transcriptional repressor
MTAARRSPKIKMADIAEALGVSAMTVSRAFKGDTGVKSETRVAILSKADELGYVFDSTAANLRQSRTGFVAVIIPSLENANFSATVRSLSKTLNKKDMQILLANTEYNPEEEERLITQLLRRNPDAIILTGSKHTKRTVSLLKKATIPVIEIWELPETPIGNVVGFSNGDAMQLLVDHLVKSGRRRIGFLGGETANDPRGQLRRAGFITALKRHGMDSHRLVPLGVAPVGMSEGAQGLDLLFERFPDADAILCVSDLVAFGALAQCARRGIKVPEVLAIAGFGNYEIGRVCEPTLTTVDVKAEAIGQRTAEVVLELLFGDADEKQMMRYEIQPDLIVRRSTH